MTGDHGGAVRYEKTDVSVGRVTRAGVLVFGVSAVVGVLLIGYVGLQLKRDERRQAAPRALTFGAERQPPLPRLQEQPFTDVRALHAEQERLLGSYGWVDRQAGVVRIPIDEAMRLFVERSSRPAPEPASPAPPAAAPATGGPAAGGHP